MGRAWSWSMGADCSCGGNKLEPVIARLVELDRNLRNGDLPEIDNITKSAIALVGL